MSRSVREAATPLMRAFTRELARAGGLLSPDYLASGLTVGEARCLYEVGSAHGIEISALADRLDLDLGHVSRVVSRLVARKLVVKRVAHADARARSVAVTTKGAKQLTQLDRSANHQLDAWLATKPAPVVDRLLDGLRGFLAEPTRADAGADARGTSPDDEQARAATARPGAPRSDAAMAGEPIVLRAPRPGELGHIIARHGEIYVRDLGYPAVFEHYVVQAFADFATTFVAPRDQIWVAELGGRFAGSIAVKGLARASSQLRFLIVEPEARGRGLGKQLVQRVIEHARVHGDRRIVLDTASDLAVARGIYAAHGFVRTGNAAEPWLPDGVQSEHWELVLDPEPRARPASSASLAVAARGPRAKPRR